MKLDLCRPAWIVESRSDEGDDIALRTVVIAGKDG